MQVTTNDHLKSKEQMLTELFMSKMRDPRQAIPVRPCIPSLEIRKLRASLMLEETLETIKAMGLCAVDAHGRSIETGDVLFAQAIDPQGKSLPVDLVEVADGLADVHVVGPCGTASAFGIALAPVYRLISCNNLLKFAEGHSFRADGKLQKPASHPSPTKEIAAELQRQGADDASVLKHLEREWAR